MKLWIPKSDAAALRHRQSGDGYSWSRDVRISWERKYTIDAENLVEIELPDLPEPAEQNMYIRPDGCKCLADGDIPLYPGCPKPMYVCRLVHMKEDD
jgi:hypothetical protein